jgi:hypothetical protein
MIDFSFGLQNPLIKKSIHNNCYEKDWKVSKNKVIDFHCGTINYIIVSFAFNLTFKTDHAGLHIFFGVLGFYFNFDFHDTRHWNNKENRWYLPSEEDMEFIQSISEFDNEDK